MKNSIKVTWKIQNRTTIWSTSGLYPKELKTGSLRDICTLTFRATLLTIAKRWKQTRCPSIPMMDKQMWSIHTMECYSAFKGKEILSHANMYEPWGHYAKCYKPVTKKTNTLWFHLYEISKVVKFTETEIEWCLQGMRGREMESCLLGIVSDVQDENILKICFTAIRIYLLLNTG